MKTERPARLCLVIDRLEVAGGPRLFEHLAQRLDRRRFDVALVTSSDSPLWNSFSRIDGLRLLPLSFPRPLDPAVIWRLSRIFQRERFDIVHSMGLRSDFHTRFAAALARPRPIVVSTVAMLAGGFDVGPLRRWLYERAENLGQSGTSLFFTDSKRTKNLLLKKSHIPSEKIQTFYIGADPEQFNPEKVDGTSARPAGEKGALVASLGRFVAQKGHDIFLEAMGRHGEKHPATRALVMGEGPLETALLVQRQRVFPSAIFSAPRRDLPQVLKALDVLVIASRIESIPILLYEAMAMAKPIIATAVGGIPEVLSHGETGLLVPPEDPEALAQAIDRLVENPTEASRMGEAARRRALAHFTVGKCVEGVARAYESVLSRAPRE